MTDGRIRPSLQQQIYVFLIVTTAIYLAYFESPIWLRAILRVSNDAQPSLEIHSIKQDYNRHVDLKSLAAARSCLLSKFGRGAGSLPDKKVYSQLEEDGIIEAIYECIGEETKYFVEFGVQDGSECTTRYLREQKNWTGLMMDGGFDKPEINLHRYSLFGSLQSIQGRSFPSA